MVATSTGDHARALVHAEQGLAVAPAGVARAQLHAWAQLPALADAARVLEADPAGSAPGRSGFDPAEYELPAAGARLVLGRPRQAAALSETSAGNCPAGTPGGAAALVLAQAEATFYSGQAEQRAFDVLDHVPAARLRSTARTRLRRLDTALAHAGTALRERLRILPLPIDHHGAATA